MPIGPGPALPADVVAHARAEGVLESPWIWLALTAAAVACAVLVCVRRRRWVIAALVVFALLAAVTGLNSYVGYVRTPHDLGVVLARGPWPVAPIGRMLVVDTGDGGQDDPSAAGARALRRARSVQVADDRLRCCGSRCRTTRCTRVPG